VAAYDRADLIPIRFDEITARTHTERLPPSHPRQPGPVNGSLIIEGPEAADGTTFTPIRIESDRIGSYAG
jgi:hypothetical protein